MKSAQQKWP